MSRIERGHIQGKGLEVDTRGIFPEESAPSIRVVSVEANEERIINSVNQKTGRDMLYEVLKGERTMANMPAIYVTELRRDRKYALFHIRSGLSSINLNNEVQEVYDGKKEILFIPQQDSQYGYSWIDIFELEDGEGGKEVNIDKKIDSVRINVNRTERWHGRERQLFIDYMTNNISVEDPCELTPFFAPVNKTRGVPIGTVNKNHIKTNLPGHGEPPEKIFIVPRHDHELGYLWIEGYESETSVEEKPLLTKRIVQKDDDTKEIVAWRGPEIQSIVDWVYGKLPVNVVRKLEVHTNSSPANFFIEAPNLLINLERETIDKSLPVYFVAAENELYKWIEIQQDDKELGSRNVITHYLVDTSEDDKPRLRGGWQGPNSQAIADYIDGKIDLSFLSHLTVILGNSQEALICWCKGKELRISLRNNKYSVGDVLRINPLIDDEGRLVLETSKEDNPNEVISRSFFNSESTTFNTTMSSSVTKKPSRYWTPEVIEREAREFVSNYGDLNAPLLRNNGQRKLLERIYGNYPGGMAALRKKLSSTESNIEVSITPEQANEELMRFLEIKD